MNYYAFDVIDSTNEEAKRLAQYAQFDESVITANRQTKGRGRLGRIWHSESDGGLYYTILLRPKSVFTHIHTLSVAVGKEVVRAIERAYHIQTELEWPNDIILDQKKVGGILIESHSGSSDTMPHYLIIGIGINVNQWSFPDELKAVAISFFQKTGIVYDKQVLVPILTDAILGLRL